MSNGELAFVTVDRSHDGLRASLRLGDVALVSGDLQGVLSTAAGLYAEAIERAARAIGSIRECRAARKLTPARLVWNVGDCVFELRDRLEEHGLQLDDLYAHFIRDLGVKRKWLEKAVILRRYVPEEELIPKDLNWGRCEKGTKRIAERLSARLPLK